MPLLPSVSRPDSRESESSSVSSLIHPLPKTSDQCEVSLPCESPPLCYSLLPPLPLPPSLPPSPPPPPPPPSLPPSPPPPPPPPSLPPSQACRSVPVDQSGFISHDTKAQISYISGQYPEKPELYSILRQACVRRYALEHWLRSVAVPHE